MIGLERALLKSLFPPPITTYMSGSVAAEIALPGVIMTTPPKSLDVGHTLESIACEERYAELASQEAQRHRKESDRLKAELSDFYGVGEFYAAYNGQRYRIVVERLRYSQKLDCNVTRIDFTEVAS